MADRDVAHPLDCCSNLVHAVSRTKDGIPPTTSTPGPLTQISSFLINQLRLGFLTRMTDLPSTPLPWQQTTFGLFLSCSSLIIRSMRKLPSTLPQRATAE